MIRTSRQRQLEAELELWALIRDGTLLSPDGALDRPRMLCAVKSILSTADVTKNGCPRSSHVGFAERHWKEYSGATIALADAIRAKSDPKVVYSNFASAFDIYQLPLLREPWDEQAVAAIQQAKAA